MSQRKYTGQGSRQATHTVKSPLLALSLAGIICFFIALVLGGGAWYISHEDEQEQMASVRVVPVTQTLPKPIVSTPQATPAILASSGAGHSIGTEVATPGATLAKNRPNISDEVEGVKRQGAARRAETVNPYARRGDDLRRL